MLRLIIWGIVFYFIFKFIRGFAYLSVKRSSSQKQYPNPPQPVRKQNVNGSIDLKDVVEAEFEEIKNPKE